MEPPKLKVSETYRHAFVNGRKHHKNYSRKLKLAVNFPLSQLTHKLNKDNNFNLLRFMLASAVILSHSSELADGSRRREILTRIFGTISFGELAVYGFFTLSGFLIAQSWLTNPSLTSFLKKRILRIYPAFIICSLVCAFVFGRLGSDSNYYSQLNIFKLLEGIFYLHLPAIPSVFRGTPYPLVNVSMWSVCYEFRCYLILALFGVLGLFSRKYAWLVFSIIVLVASSVPGLFTNNALSNKVYPIFGELDMLMPLLPFFCVGVCYYIFSKYIRFKPSYAITAALVSIICLFNIHTANIGLILFGSYLLFYFAFAKLPALYYFKKFPDISYGLYLYASPIQKLILWRFPSLSPWLLFPIALTLACILGWLSWTIVEKPALKLKSLSFMPLNKYYSLSVSFLKKIAAKSPRINLHSDL